MCGVLSQAARQGLAVIMVSAVVVLKHETSTICQRHTFISINLTFGASNNVREVTSPDKVGSGPMSGTDTMERCQEVIVALSESVQKNLLQRPLAEK